MRQAKISFNAITTFSLALFSIGCLIVLFVLVPLWMNLQPTEFLNWFSTNGKSVGMVMLPLEMAPFMLSLNAFIRAKKTSNSDSSLLLFANVCNIIILALFLIYFLPVNGSFMEGSIPLGEVPGALKDWRLFHIIRTVLSILALIFMALSLKGQKDRVSNTSFRAKQAH